MAVTVETISPLGHDIQYRQVISPNYLTGTFAADDADNHQFKVDTRGKSKVTVAVHNPADKDLTVTIYGMHTATGVIADAGTHSIGSFSVTAALDKNYDTIADPFPWLLVDIAYAEAPTDDPVTICILNVDMVS